MKLTLQHIIMRNPDMLASAMDEEIVMMSIQRGEYYGLDKVGSRIWNLIEKPICVNDMITLLLDEYEIDRENCEKDVLEFLEELLEKGLVKNKPVKFHA